MKEVIDVIEVKCQLNSVECRIILPIRILELFTILIGWNMHGIKNAMTKHYKTQVMWLCYFMRYKPTSVRRNRKSRKRLKPRSEFWIIMVAKQQRTRTTSVDAEAVEAVQRISITIDILSEKETVIYSTFWHS